MGRASNGRRARSRARRAPVTNMGARQRAPAIPGAGSRRRAVTSRLRYRPIAERTRASSYSFVLAQGIVRSPYSARARPVVLARIVGSVVLSASRLPIVFARIVSVVLARARTVRIHAASLPSYSRGSYSRRLPRTRAALSLLRQSGGGGGGSAVARGRRHGHPNKWDLARMNGAAPRRRPFACRNAVLTCFTALLKEPEHSNEHSYAFR